MPSCVRFSLLLAAAIPPRPRTSTRAKRCFNIVATKSADEARRWLADDFANGKKITEEVKIDLVD